jgi:hypothetical protein
LWAAVGLVNQSTGWAGGDLSSRAGSGGSDAADRAVWEGGVTGVYVSGELKTEQREDKTLTDFFLNKD